ncbi:LacI family DNA-binding transcriptional regulator [Rathayibacter soli]|uniref:LacI family DNA-binding transcriptional regulator n=1 Tax=Rathayibacter soli TaxID=3144168 RepID=UPI0027E3CB8D|nr:LacI family DNA-binding transcriptional regulator [Glaciibacter superstes]
MATMRDVAARAGVSVKTVSRVFNNDPHVLPEKRGLVEQAMRELNYVPNALATTFRSGRTAALGVAVPDVVDPFFAAIARAIDDVASTYGMSTLVTSLGEDPATEQGIVERLLGRQLTGLILAPVSTDHGWLRRWQEHTPIVFVDRAPQNLVTDSFTDDDRGGGFAATSYLIAKGHRRIAYLGRDPLLVTESDRREGYRRALAEHGIPYDPKLVMEHITERHAAAAAVAKLTALANPPTAIFSANARTSMPLTAALRGSPLAVIGFGDFPMADLLTPALTIMDQNPSRMGQLAAQRIYDRLESPTASFPLHTVLDVTLVERESA